MQARILDLNSSCGKVGRDRPSTVRPDDGAPLSPGQREGAPIIVEGLNFFRTTAEKMVFDKLSNH
jgi:hypothetical protein